MRLIIVMFYSLFCLLAGPAWAQEAATTAPNRGALFKVEQGGRTLYVFGTIHVGAADFYPLQTVATMEATLAKVVAASPDRIAIYNYAHLPQLFKPQRRKG